MATKTKNIQRSSGFRDRQTRSLYSRYYRLGAHFKETVLKYEVERSQARRREEKVREKLEELERREAFLEGRKANLLAEKLTREDSSSTSIFMSPPRTSKIRKTEAESIFKDHSGFLDQESRASDQAAMRGPTWTTATPAPGRERETPRWSTYFTSPTTPSRWTRTFFP